MGGKICFKAAGLVCYTAQKVRQMAVLTQITEEPNGRKAKSASSASIVRSIDRQDHSMQRRISFAMLLEGE